MSDLPECGLTDYLCICATTGDWVPGSIDGNPMYVAVFLEYLRRGGDDSVVEGGAPGYRAWLAANGSAGFLTKVMGIAAELERLTVDGACVECVGAYLDPMLDVLR